MVENTENDGFDKHVMQANFSAILYLLTEQQALIGRLLQVLLETGVVTSHQLNKITDITDGDEGLIPTYTQLYNRFATYYLRTKQILDEGNILDHAVEEALAKRDEDKGKKDE
jgi:hypothetical protein